jgi:LCP family protein required for cell wall assembly
LRTTLKRGIGRAGAPDGNGHAVLPPSALTPMTRYRQPEPERRSGLRLLGRVLLWAAILVLVLVLGGVAGVYLWLHESVAALAPHSAGVKAAQRQLAPPLPGKAAIALVIGYDHRANEVKGTPSRSDTVMLLRADPGTKTVSMLSFPRDLLVNVHCPGRPIYVGKINSAYATCGEPGTLQTVEDLIGLPVNYLIAVNFRGFKQVVNRLGGVWIDVDRRYFNNQGGSCYSCYATINLQPGYQLLTGGSALDYVRYRHTDSDLYRVARQQQFVKALKYELKHNFGLTTAIRLVGTLTNNVEVAQGGGGDVSVGKIASYANFIYSLPSGHFIQTQIQGLSGYSDLTTSQTNIQAAVQEWLNPNPNAGKAANAVALGEKVRTRTPTAAQTSITVLNGNGVLGAAANAGYLLRQRGYHVVSPPPNATGNAPRSDYFPSMVYWNPRVRGSAAAAASVAKLFAPADTARLPRELLRLQQSTMLTVVVGTPFHGSITPAPPAQVSQTRQPPHVTSNPYGTTSQLRAIQKKAGFRLMTPTVIERSSSPDQLKPLYLYRIQGSNHAVRLVFQTGGLIYWGIEETNWPDAPILSDRSFRHDLGGREFDFYYNGPKLHMIVLRQGDNSYWVVNSLLDDLSNETMIAIAKGLKPVE